MIAGIFLGLAAAFLQSCSYILSRMYISKYEHSRYLSVYSQVLMGIIGAVLLGAVLPFARCPDNWMFAVYAVLWASSYIVAQGCFLAAIKLVEASRLSSLLGAKIIVLAFLAVSFYGRDLGAVRWISVALCAVSAFGMNFSGGGLPVKSIIYMSVTVCMFAVGDICCAQVLFLMPESNSMFINSLGATAVCYLILGLITLPALFFTPCRLSLCKDALPYSIVWFSSIVFLLGAIGKTGVVYASIIQSGRGVISVLLGVLLARLGFSHLESKESRTVWIRRGIMALLMMLSIILYIAGNGS